MKMYFKQIEIDGKTPFAKGATAECYRLNEDTILKLYHEDFSEEWIRREKESARAALVAGIPTAISFDCVQVNGRKGIIYEYVKGKTISEVIVHAPSRSREMGNYFAEVAKSVHNARIVSDKFPPATQKIRSEVSKLGYVSKNAKIRILALLDELDTFRHYVHGDFHVNNVIITDDGPLLIDMGDFSIGCPMFDLATAYFSLFESPEAMQGTRSSFSGLSRKESLDFWRGFAEGYGGGKGFDYSFGREEGAGAGLFRKVLTLKKMYFENAHGRRYTKEYCRNVRQETLKVFDSLKMW